MTKRSLESYKGWLTAVALVALSACTPESPAAKSDAEYCSDRDPGCFCASEGQELPCYDDAVYEDSDLVCGVGTQTCRGGRWSVCSGVEERRTNLSGALIAPPTECNPCNPACFVATDESLETDDLTPENSTNLEFDPVTGGVISTSITTDDTPSYGPMGDTPFDPTSDPSENVELDTDGAIILGQNATVNDSIWIANTGEGTISRFDINTFAETGRFWAGPLGSGNDPSRTSINTAGDAFVAGRDGIFVTKILGRGMDCPDTNLDGVITTSLNGTALPWGQDDCVVWSRDMTSEFPGGKLRAVAAQDIVDGTTGDVTEYVWAGGYNDRRISLLDGSTGAILMTAYVEYRPYGFALDGSGNLWISTLYDNRLIRVDTNLCNAGGCVWDGVCNEATDEGTACDGAVKQAIPTDNNNDNYGVTVDAAQRVWLGGRNDVMRYDQSVSPRWVSAGIGSVGGWKAGIAADGRGNIWTTGGFGVYRLEAANPTNWHLIAYNATNDWVRGWGVAVAADDRTWVIGRNDNAAWVIEPGAALATNTLTQTANTVVSPYTYSDMTGQQLRLAATPRGTYVMRFEGCGEGTRWEDLAFDVETPPDTAVSFRIRVADTTAGLAGATWYGLGRVPPGASPLPVRSVLDLAGVPHGQFAEVEVALESSILDPTMFVTPRVLGVELRHTCSVPEVGTYSRVYNSVETCEVPPDRPSWDELEYTVETPGDSSVDVILRSADTESDLAIAPEAIISIPALPDSGSVNLPALLASAGLPIRPLFLEVRLRLNPSTTGESAILYSLSTRWECVPEE